MYEMADRKLKDGKVLTDGQLEEITEVYEHYERTNWERDSLYWMAMEVPNLLATIASLRTAIVKQATTPGDSEGERGGDSER